MVLVSQSTPAEFFLPTSPSTLVAAFGALISGWKTPFGYRVWLGLSALLILAVWVFTVVAFWPSNAALFAYASSATSGAKGEAELIRLTRQWWCGTPRSVRSRSRSCSHVRKASFGRPTGKPAGAARTESGFCEPRASGFPATLMC